MGTTLTGTTPQDTYDSLIKVTDNGPLSGTAKYLSDGLGNDSALAVSTARVGVGLNTPTVKLESSGAVKAASISFGAEGGYFLNYGGNAGSRSYRIANDSNTFGDFVIQQSTTQTGSTYVDRLAISASGNVGIGTSSPTGKLTVSQANSGGVAAILLTEDESTIQGPSANTYLKMGGNMTFGAAGVIPIQIATTEVLRVTSNGLTFNGDTAAANALDDYEEGTWTMGITFGGASVGVTYGANTGTYTKIGRQVTVNGYLALTSKGSSTGNARITGLPFTISNGNSFYSAASLWLNGVSFINQYSGVSQINTTNIELFETTTLGALTTITDADFANNSEVIVGFTYFV